MDRESTLTEEIVNAYKAELTRLTRYIPWFETKGGRDAATQFTGDGLAQSSISFPVYDSTLMSFINEARSMSLMNYNYVYTYSKCHLRTTQDEMDFISKATIREFGNLADILSKHVLSGMTKARVWSEAVENRIFLNVIVKMKEIIEFWDKPLA